MLKFGIRQAGGCGRRPKNAKPTTKPNVQTQKKAPRPPEAPRRRPEAPGGARRHPGGARRGPREASRGLKGAPKPGSAPRKRGHQRPPKAPQRPRRPPDGFGAPKATIGRQPETRKGIKLGGCLRKQGVGKRNQHTSSWFVAHERCAVA